ncbi:glycosyltransferase family 4 protein [Candidatus Kaiserbacteria bacterium]|nr:glycosyltransferase family 4 protein [Candidatus Kaiserbacteria bacterium]
MKLLILTQKIDKTDPVLGFFHRWVEEFAKHSELVTVICLYEGEHNLPDNVRVLSLGKEEGVSRLTYVIRFYKYIFTLRKNYDSVFVHMNTEYIILGAILWKILRKKVALWYNHQHAGLMARFSFLLPQHIFYTADKAYAARVSKSHQMPVGVDSDFFKGNKDVSKKPRSILFLSRISPVKRLDVLIEAVSILTERGIECTLSVYGDVPERDKKHYDSIYKSARALVDKGVIFFKGSISTSTAPTIYNEYEIYVNLTNSGSFDKTIIESACSETITLVSNTTLEGDFETEYLFKEGDALDCANKLQNLLGMDISKKKKAGMQFRLFGLKHDVNILVQKITEYLE